MSSFHVTGIGAVGSLLAFNLRRAFSPTNKVHLIHRNIDGALHASAKRQEIRVTTNGVTQVAGGFLMESLPLRDATDPTQLIAKNWTRTEPIESLFVTTKAHQVTDVIRRLLPRIDNHTTIVLLQNGMGILEELLVHLFHDPSQRPHFILASNTHGVYQSAFLDVIHTGIGALEFGIVPSSSQKNYETALLSPDSEHGRGSLDDITTQDDPQFERFRSLRNSVAALLRMDGLQPSWKPIAQIELAMRRKLVVNSVINPLTALMGCRNGDLLDAPGYNYIRNSLCQEASRIFAAQTKRSTTAWIDSLVMQGVDVESVSMGRLPVPLTRRRLEIECDRVARLTKNNISSMLADVRRGQKTEIEYMNGYLLALAKTYGVNAPTTANLRDLVRMRAAIPLDQ